MSDHGKQYDQAAALQVDLFARLEADPFFADAGIFLQRDGTIDWEFKRSSMLWQGREGSDKVGLALVVGMPGFKLGGDNTRIPQFEGESEIAIYEFPEMNRASGGTRISVEQAGFRVAALLNEYWAVGLAGAVLVPAGQSFSQVELRSEEDNWNVIALAVPLRYALANEAPAVWPNPQIDIADPAGDDYEVTVTGSGGAGERLYYTTNQSYPSAENENAALYKGPFTLEVPEADRPLAVRAVAYGALGATDIPSGAACAVIPAA